MPFFILVIVGYVVGIAYDWWWVTTHPFTGSVNPVSSVERLRAIPANTSWQDVSFAYDANIFHQEVDMFDPEIDDEPWEDEEDLADLLRKEKNRHWIQDNMSWLRDITF